MESQARITTALVLIGYAAACALPCTSVSSNSGGHFPAATQVHARLAPGPGASHAHAAGAATAVPAHAHTRGSQDESPVLLAQCACGCQQRPHAAGVSLAPDLGLLSAACLPTPPAQAFAATAPASHPNSRESQPFDHVPIAFLL